MRRMLALASSLVLTALLALSVAAQDKPSAKPAAEPKSDAEIQKCISDKLAASTSIKDGSATVSNGEATLTGAAKNSGAKGAATRMAKRCGANKVTNNITVEAKPAGKKAAAEEKKSTP